jgi:hypothetical protein
MRSLRQVVAVLLVVTLGACGDDRAVSDGAPPDAAPDTGVDISVDGPVVDGPAVDLPVFIDSCMCDSATPDLPPPDLPAPDLPSPDGPVVPDSFMPNDAGGLIVPPFGADEMAKTCVRVAACIQESANACLADAYASGDFPWSTAVNCLASANNGCAALDTCMGYTYQTGYCGPTVTTQCTGPDTWEVCMSGSDPMKITMDCQKIFGTGCVTFSSSMMGSGCSSGTPCAGTGSFCKGAIAATCLAGNEMLNANCTQAGLPCRNGGCAGPGEACYSSGAICEGSDTIAYCVGDYRLRIKCSDFGPAFSCVASGSGARCQQGTQCNPATASETCVGNQLQLCNGGTTVLVDCTALGFASCANGACVP